MRLLAKVQSRVSSVRKSRPWNIFWAVASAIMSLGIVWADFWLGHVLNTHWPLGWTLGWWFVPFCFTTFISLGVFFNSMSAVSTQLRRKFNEI